MTLPLTDYTVLDLSGSVATATCGRVFADFGARVVNVEHPSTGHPTRRLPPFDPALPAPDNSGIHALLSPNKESLALDIRDPSRREELLEWVQTADVVLESERPGTLDELGIGFEALKTVAPRLILCSLTWWGQSGPLAQRPGDDQSVLSVISQVINFGPKEGPPLLMSGYPVQILGGVTGFAGAAVHLLSSVLGQKSDAAHVDVSLLESAMALKEPTGAGVAANPDGVRSGRPNRLGINRFYPTYPAAIYETSDGWLGVTALTPTQWHSFCRLAGVEELSDDPHLDIAANRILDADRIDAVLVPALKKRPAEEWFREGQELRVPLALVPTMAELFDSAQLRAVDAFREITLPGGRTLEVPGQPFRLHRTPARKDGHIARLGEHRPLKVEPRSTVSPELPRFTGAKGVSASSPKPRPVHEPDRRPDLLRGLRVIDLSMGWAGPLCARHLADVGAEVIKVESRQYFDWWRDWDLTPERIAERLYEKAPNFNIMNRNKRGVTLDLTDPKGKDLLKRLVAISDVVIENYSAGVLPKLGLDEPVLRRVNPRMVMLSMPPFGAGGPWHMYRAYGSTVEQASGLPHLQGRPGDPPAMTHVALGDPVAGVNGLAGLLIAVLHQQRTGEGQYLDISHVEASTTLGLHGVAGQVLLGEPPPRYGSRDPRFAPRGVYPCAGDENWVTLTVDSDDAWPGFADLVCDEDLRQPKFARLDARWAEHDLIDEKIARWTRVRERDVVVDQLLDLGIPAAPVLRPAEILTHPHLEARGYWQWLEREYAGLLPHPTVPYRTGDGPFAIDSPAPTLGEHSREILSALLDLGEEELDNLEADRIIGTVPDRSF
ncbi:MAG: CoA transferase [Chloroflexi bacterium]|nr:CoA transferase [Chloroflexota bacterium]